MGTRSLTMKVVMTAQVREPIAKLAAKLSVRRPRAARAISEELGRFVERSTKLALTRPVPPPDLAVLEEPGRSRAWRRYCDYVKFRLALLGLPALIDQTKELLSRSFPKALDRIYICDAEFQNIALRSAIIAYFRLYRRERELNGSTPCVFANRKRD